MSAAVSFRGLSKRFPGVLALDRVSFEVKTATCHAVVGENGAGKSTLGRILAGICAPDEGGIELNGISRRFGSPHDARVAGVGIVHQELAYCPNMSVAENIHLGAIPSLRGFVKTRILRETALLVLDQVGADCSPDDEVGHLPIAQIQLVQIATALASGARVLVMDEPTSSLSKTDAERLHTLIRRLRSEGRTILYISHRMDEIFALCDGVTVLRDGCHVATKAGSETTQDEVVQLMVGRPVSAYFKDAHLEDLGSELLRVEHLSDGSRFDGIGFNVRAGEVVGLAGLVGAGRTEIAKALFGLVPTTAGRIFIGGARAQINSPSSAMAYGIGLVPEDRKKQGLVLGMSCSENIGMASLDVLSRWGFLRRAAERSMVAAFFQRLGIRAASPDHSAESLSGGNQQKLVLAKWLGRRCRILLLDEPTRGIDVGGKADIHRVITELVTAGHGILLISSELPELLALSHRVLVLRNGRLVGELERADATEERVVALMAGAASTPFPTRGVLR